MLERGGGRVYMTRLSRHHSGIGCLVRGVVSDHCLRIRAGRAREKAIANEIHGRSQGDPGAGGMQSAAALRRLQGLWI